MPYVLDLNIKRDQIGGRGIISIIYVHFKGYNQPIIPYLNTY